MRTFPADTVHKHVTRNSAQITSPVLASVIARESQQRITLRPASPALASFDEMPLPCPTCPTRHPSPVTCHLHDRTKPRPPRQGAKQMRMGSEADPYDTSRFLTTSLDLPGTSEVTTASRELARTVQPRHWYSNVPCLGTARSLAETLKSQRRSLFRSRGSSERFTTGY